MIDGDLWAARIDLDLCLRLPDPYRRIGLCDRHHRLGNVDCHHGAEIDVESLALTSKLLRGLLQRLAGFLRVLVLNCFKGTLDLCLERGSSLLIRAVRLLALLDLLQDLLENLTGPLCVKVDGT